MITMKAMMAAITALTTKLRVLFLFIEFTLVYCLISG
jgi:hypothetical protein